MHTLPYGKFNGDITITSMFFGIALIRLAGAKEFNLQGTFNLMVSCVSAI